MKRYEEVIAGYGGRYHMEEFPGGSWMSAREVDEFVGKLREELDVLMFPRQVQEVYDWQYEIRNGAPSMEEDVRAQAAIGELVVSSFNPALLEDMEQALENMRALVEAV